VIGLKKIGTSLVRNFKNIPGWKTNRKLIVIESDDWGSIRVPSREVFDLFVQKGFRVCSSHYNRLDALESNDDLAALFTVLRKHKDIHGRHPCFTANVIMANPDFAKIRATNFQEYHHEHFTETLRRYPSHDQVFSFYQQGIVAGFFHPQFHGREHLNINRWMKALQSQEETHRFTFDLQTTYSGKDDYNYMEALDMDSPSELELLKPILQEGLHSFQQTFGFASKSFIAPCYTWSSQLNDVLSMAGVTYIQGGMHQYIPKGGFDNYDVKRHVLGERNSLGQIYLTRNCFFEPALVQKNDWVDYTLSSIRDAFRWNKPAIICAHRINFIGSIDEGNRTGNLKLLDQLLEKICSVWPSIEFITSDQLGDLINAKQNE
jgi:hypothetical protein